jgi:hypothetical protein
MEDPLDAGRFECVALLVGGPLAGADPDVNSALDTRSCGNITGGGTRT